MFNIEDKVWTEVKCGTQGPNARSGHSMILDYDTDKIYIFGGQDLNLVWEANDFYQYDIKKN